MVFGAGDLFSVVPRKKQIPQSASDSSLSSQTIGGLRDDSMEEWGFGVFPQPPLAVQRRGFSPSARNAVPYWNSSSGATSCGRRAKRPQAPELTGLVESGLATDGIGRFINRFRYQAHPSVIASLQSEDSEAAIAQPIELRALANRVWRKLEQLAVAKVTKFGGALRVVTLRDHDRSSLTIADRDMDAWETRHRCPVLICVQERKEEKLTFDADLVLSAKGALREPRAKHSSSASAEKLLFLFAVRLLSTLRALARAFGGSYVVGVVVIFLHCDLRK